MLLHPFNARLSRPDCFENRQGRHDVTNVQQLFPNTLFGPAAANASPQSKEVWLCADGVGLFAICLNLLCSLSERYTTKGNANLAFKCAKNDHVCSI